MLFIRLRSLQPLKLAQTRFLSATGNTGITIGDRLVQVWLDPAIWSRQDEANSEWRTVINTFWKKPLSVETPVVAIEAAKMISSGFPTDIFVTAERRLIYDRIQQVRQSRAPGVVVTGQPGIGKSSSIPYFMIRELGAGRPLYLMNASERVFFVAKEGVWSSPAWKVIESFPLRWTERLLVLIDSAQQQKPPNEAVQEAGFCVFCPSPAIARYKEMLKQGHGLFVMDPWKWDELREFASYTFPEYRDRELSEALDKAQDVCPPTPRALEAYLESISTQRDRCFDPETNSIAVGIVRAAEAVKSSRELNTTELRYRPEVSHKLFCLRRSAIPPVRNRAGIAPQDFSHLEYASDFARDRLEKRVENFLVQDICEAYAAASHHPNTVVSKGYLYETLFIRTLSGSSQGVKFSDIFKLEARSKRTTIPFHGYVRGPGAITKKVRNAPNWNQPYQTEFFKSSSAERIVPRLGVLFVPKGRSNALFDAFVLQKEEHGQPATLWFIQLTVTSTHDANKAGYDLITAIHNRVLTDFPKADVGYLLICPYEQEKYVWHFDDPGNMAETLCRRPEEGRVFVQGFDLDEKFPKSS